MACMTSLVWPHEAYYQAGKEFTQLNSGGRHLRWGGGENDLSACVSTHLLGGSAPPGTFRKLDALRLLLRSLFPQSGTTVICTSYSGRC